MKEGRGSGRIEIRKERMLGSQGSRGEGGWAVLSARSGR